MAPLPVNDAPSPVEPLEPLPPQGDERHLKSGHFQKIFGNSSRLDLRRAYLRRSWWWLIVFCVEELKRLIMKARKDRGTSILKPMG